MLCFTGWFSLVLFVKHFVLSWNEAGSCALLFIHIWYVSKHPSKKPDQVCTYWKPLTLMPPLIFQIRASSPTAHHLQSAFVLPETCDQQRLEWCDAVLLTQVEIPPHPPWGCALIEWRPSRVDAPLEHVPFFEYWPSHWLRARHESICLPVWSVMDRYSRTPSRAMFCAAEVHISKITFRDGGKELVGLWVWKAWTLQR